MTSRRSSRTAHTLVVEGLECRGKTERVDEGTERSDPTLEGETLCSVLKGQDLGGVEALQRRETEREKDHEEDCADKHLPLGVWRIRVTYR